jgi:thioesterase domain-containing protein
MKVNNVENDLVKMANISALPSIWRLISKNNDQVIVKLNEGNEGLPVYLIHPLAGDVSSYRELVNALGPHQRIFGVQATRSILKSDFVKSIELLAQHYVNVLTSYQPNGPLVLAGWSVGAAVALEMAHQLRALGRQVPLLVVLDGILANSCGGLRIWDPRYYWQLFYNIPRWIAHDLIEERRSLTRRLRAKILAVTPNYGGRAEKNENIHKMDAYVNTTGWLPEQVSFARKLHDAGDVYIPKPYDGRVVIYAAKTQPLFHLFQVEATWGQTCSCVETVRIDGTHLNFLRQPRVLALANDLRARLQLLCVEQELDHDGLNGRPV